MNKASLKIFFELLLKPLDIPQSRTVPPDIYDAIYNTSASWLVDKIVELWPKDQSYVDIIEPFLKTEIVRVVGGNITLPESYRNFLDVGALVEGDFTGKCKDCDDYEVDSQAVLLRKYNQAISKSGCKRQAIRIVDQTEWDYLTQDAFDFPTITQPIGCFFGTKQIRICPAEIAIVELRYLINENIYRYGYIPQPDDTFIFNPVTSVESQFTNAAFSKLYKPAMALLSLYLRDGNLAGFVQGLNDVQFK